MSIYTKLGDGLIEEALSWKGTPFFHKIRKKGVGADCLGLVLGAWEIVNNVQFERDLMYNLPLNLQTNYTKLEVQFFEIVHKIPISQKQNGDVICFQFSNQQLHLAYYAQRKGIETLVHSRMNIGVTEEAYSSFWKSKTYKTFRLLEA